MPAARYAVRPGSLAYGIVCPECAGPKHRQSHRCAACFVDALPRADANVTPWVPPEARL